MNLGLEADALLSFSRIAVDEETARARDHTPHHRVTDHRQNYLLEGEHEMRRAFITVPVCVCVGMCFCLCMCVCMCACEGISLVVELGLV